MSLLVFFIVVAVSIAFYFFSKQKTKTSETTDSKAGGPVPTNNGENKAKSNAIPYPQGNPPKERFQ
jgi:uncharacterized protein (UPF0333 family)